MSDFEHHYKEKAFRFRGASEARLLRVEKREEVRKQQRTKTFNTNRNILSANLTPQSEATAAEAPVVVEDRMTRLMRWRANRARQKKIELQKKKPPFKVGVVHHRIYSPVSKDVNETMSVESHSKAHVKSISNVKQSSTDLAVKTIKKISKVTEKRLKAKAVSKKNQSNKFLKPEKYKTNNAMQHAQRETKSFAPANYTFKPPPEVSQIPLFGTVALMDDRIKNFLLSPAKRRSAARRSGITPFATEKLNSKENKIPSNKSINMDSEETKNDTSIESIVLRLSSAHEPQNLSLEDTSQNMASSTNLPQAGRRRSNTSSCTTEGLEVQRSEKTALNTSTGSRTRDKCTVLLDRCDVDLNSTFGSKVQQQTDSLLNNLKTVQTPPNATHPSNLDSSTNEPAFFSPYVVSSRGKSNARKEQQIRRGLGFSPDDGVPTKDTVMQSLNISVEEEERTAQYFHFLLNKEIERLEALCNKWTAIMDEPDVPEDGHYEINQAIGQTNLLINKKFQRFRGLVNDCETGKGEMLVTCKDLQGFWDMMYREIKDCNSRFENLEKLQAQNWREEIPEIKSVVTKKAISRKKKKPTAAVRKQSSLRDIIMAARKQKNTRQGSLSDGESMGSTITVSSDAESVASGGSTSSIAMVHNSPKPKNSRRSKSGTIQQSKLTPANRESTRLSLLQQVQLSQTTKELRSPLAMMKISKLCKTPEVQLEGTLPYINSEQTPSRSILKRTKDPKDQDSVAKSSHKVNFNDTVVLTEVPEDEEVQTKLNLAAALAKIDSFDLDSIEEKDNTKVERKLKFDTDSSDEFPDNRDGFEERKVEKSKQDSSKNQNNFQNPIVKIEPISPHLLSPSTRHDCDSLRRSPRLQLSKGRRSRSILKSKPLEDSEANKMLEQNGISEEDTRATRIRRQTLTRLDAIDEDSSDEDDVRTLRNRSINPKDTETSKRKSLKADMNHKENQSPSKMRSKRSLRAASKDDKEIKVSSNSLEVAVGRMSLSDNRRRSTRRSVKFSETDCTGCAEPRTPLPMTPHVRRSKGKASERNRRHTISQDLSSLKTPDSALERVTRSQSRKL